MSKLDDLTPREKNLFRIIEIKCRLAIAEIKGLGTPYQRGRKKLAEEILKDIEDYERKE